MKNKFNIQKFLLAILVVVMGLTVVSCRYEINVVDEVGGARPNKEATPSGSDRDEEKGHDNWARVEIIIRKGHLHGANFHGDPKWDIPIIPIIQKVVFENTPSGVKRTIDKGENMLRKDDEAVVIIAAPDNGDRRYSMEIIYYNSRNERINYQFLTQEQLPIHQHFFTISEYVNLKTKKIFTAPKTEFFTDLHSYVYRDTNPEDKMLGQSGTELLRNNPVGLKGYFQFKEKSKLTRFNMTVRLNHFKFSKFDSQGKADEANNPSRRARLQSVTDFLQEIPFVVIGFDGSDSDAYFKEVAEYYNITTDEVEDYILGSDIDPESSAFWM